LVRKIAARDAAEMLAGERRRGRAVERRREHAAAAELAHEPSALGYELECARKIESAGRDEGRVLAEAVAARQERLDAAFGQRLESGETGDLVRQERR